MAREIHDELGQILTALKMDLSWMRNQLKLKRGKEPLIEKIKTMSKLVDVTINTLQRISRELRPTILDDLGLEAAIEWQAREFEKRTTIKCEMMVNSSHITCISDHSIEVFRIFQETLRNIARHAKAKEVRVTSGIGLNTVVMSIIDNGKGITEAQISDSKSLGLIGMRERANSFGGDIRIAGHPGKGTIVSIFIPIMK